MTVHSKKYFLVFCGIFAALFIFVAAGAWQRYSQLENDTPASSAKELPRRNSTVAQDE